MEQACELLSLPKTLGKHPETDKEIKKSIGKYGPYIVHDGDFRSLKKGEEFFAVDLKEALSILSKEKTSKRRKSKTMIKEFQHSDQVLQVLQGPYGPYIKFNKKNVTIPKDYEPEKLSLKQALDIIKNAPKKSRKKA